MKTLLEIYLLAGVEKVPNLFEQKLFVQAQIQCVQNLSKFSEILAFGFQNFRKFNKRGGWNKNVVVGKISKN